MCKVLATALVHQESHILLKYYAASEFSKRINSYWWYCTCSMILSGDEQCFCFQNLTYFSGYFDPEINSHVMKMNIFWGDLTHVSAIEEALVMNDISNRARCEHRSLQYSLWKYEDVFKYSNPWRHHRCIATNMPSLLDFLGWNLLTY